MSFSAGYKAVVKINGVDVSVYCDKASMDRAQKLLETSTFSDTAETYIPGLAAGAFTGSGPLDGTATNIDATLNTLFTTAAGVSFEFDPAGTGTGTPKYSGTIMCDKYNESSDAKGLASFSFSTKVTGGITRGTN